ncbi:hypothetical protein ACEQ8H_004334 [Pleosporales sp. CAS-2024a]
MVSVGSSSPNDAADMRPAGRPQQYRILPPSIRGHYGHLIFARRTVPYWIGALLVCGTFSWAVWYEYDDAPRRADSQTPEAYKA